MFRVTARSAGWILLALYAFTVLVTLGWTPLWLDEVQQFGNTRHNTIPELMRWVQLNAGASPLPYLAQRAVVNVLGYSAFAARLPAALSSILAGGIFAALCARFLGTGRIVALAVFLAIPLQFRYGLEARGYSQGLLFSVAALWLFLLLREKATLSRALFYGSAVALGLYSQPLACFPALGQTAYGWRQRYAAVAAGAGAAIFLPWYIFQHRAQAEYALSIKPTAFFSWRQVMPQVLLHDLSGGGYACTAALLALAIWGAWGPAADRAKRSLLLYVAVISLAGPILMDIVFNYFFAERQLLFALPALILLAGLGWERCMVQGHKTAAAVLLAVLLISSGIKDFRLATVAKDDLARTADAIAATLPPGACFVTAPPGHAEYYQFLRPELEGRSCGPDQINPQVNPALNPEILGVTDSYTTDAERASFVAARAAAYEPGASARVGRSEITRYHRR